jgi:hypothetical protein
MTAEYLAANNAKSANEILRMLFAMLAFFAA